jgi:hypothetical protein
MWAGSDNDDQRKIRLGLSGMVWVRQTLTTGESDPTIAPSHAVGLLAAGCLSAEPPLENRTKRIVCDGFSDGKQEVQEKLSLLSLTFFFRRKSHLRPKVPICIRRLRPATEIGLRLLFGMPLMHKALK